VKPSLSSPFGFLFVAFIACLALYTGLWWGHSFSDLCPVNLPAASVSSPAASSAEAPVVSCTTLNKLFAWAYDFRISDLFLVLFTGLLALKISGLDKATRALQRLGADQAETSKDAAAASREALFSSQEQIALSRQALVDSNRAFLFVERIEWKAIASSVNGVKKLSWGFIVHWRNSGTTPTRKMQSCVYETVFVYKKLLEDFDYADNKGHDDMVVFPRATMHSRPLRLDPEYFALAQSGHAEVYIWGWADYGDFFEGTPRRRVEFCLSVEAIGDPKSPECKFAFHKHGPFNGHDEECYREAQPYRPIAPAVKGTLVTAEASLDPA